MGPLLFSLVLQQLLLRVRAARPDLALNVSFLDDGSIAGPIGDVWAAFRLISTEGPDLGLTIRLKKCLLWWPTTMDPVLLGKVRVLY